MKTAFITGVTGQDGAYLSKLLLEKGYNVVGGIRRNSSPNTWRLDDLGITEKIKLETFDLSDVSNASSIIAEHKPDEVYNLAAQSFVGASFTQPLYTAEIDGIGVANVLEAIRTKKPDAKFYQASTSELFGKVQEIPQSETTPFYPRSPYAVAKLYGHWITVNYREAYDMFACSGILFSHESPLRGSEFVTRKITITLAKIRVGRADVLELGNMDAQRDWGFAGDYVEGMHRILNAEKPDDFVLATGETHSVEKFVNIAASHLDFDLEWDGEGDTRRALDKKTGKTIVQTNQKFYRPTEVDLLLGTPKKAEEKLGWKRKTSFEDLVEMMVKADYEKATNSRSFYIV